jgi:hypothetical protein
MIGRAVAASICVALCLMAGACNRSDTPAEPTHTAAASASPSAAPVASHGEAATDPACANICRNTLALHCSKAAACAENCQTMAQSPVCGELMHAVLVCFGKQPLERWECDEDGNAAIKDGFCDAEQSAFAHCAQSH